MKRYRGKVAIITGCGGEIGKATCLRLLEEGANIVITDHSEEKLRIAAQQMENRGFNNNVKYIKGDVRYFEDCVKIADFTKEIFGKIDILIAAAGIIRNHPIDEMSKDDWKDVIDVNLTGVYHSAKAVVDTMKKQNYGRMVFISSLGGRTGRPGVGVNYAASKAGIVGITQSLGYELGPWNITVNSVAPGPIKGEMFNSHSKEYVQQLTSGVRIPRLGNLSEISAATAYLASDEAGWTTGEILDVNGGLYY